MASRIIDDFPTRRQVEGAEPYDLVRWFLYLRPTMINEELDIVKAIAQRYDRMPDSVRAPLVARAHREYGGG